jgi:hypothetical protein
MPRFEGLLDRLDIDRSGRRLLARERREHRLR